MNYLAILVASVINMVLGMLWYGPFFGKSWMRMTGVTTDMVPEGQKKKSMMKSSLIGFILALISNTILERAIAFRMSVADVSGAGVGLAVGFILWLGFVLIVTSGSYLWEGKPLKLWAIYSGYYLVLFLINGALLAVWI